MDKLKATLTDEENKRQRHLAEMMIAQCDGKIVQDFGRNVDPEGRWIDIETPIAGHYYQHAKLRIKPEPREWWLCLGCNGRFAHNHEHHNRHEISGVSPCAGVLVRVREVLHD
jgi:hypothetical protein